MSEQNHQLIERFDSTILFPLERTWRHLAESERMEKSEAWERMEKSGDKKNWKMMKNVRESCETCKANGKWNKQISDYFPIRHSDFEFRLVVNKNLKSGMISSGIFIKEPLNFNRSGKRVFLSLSLIENCNVLISKRTEWPEKHIDWGYNFFCDGDITKNNYEVNIGIEICVPSENSSQSGTHAPVDQEVIA